MPMPGPQIRIATIEEAESIAAVLREAFMEFEPAYTPEAFAATTPTSDQPRARWDEGRCGSPSPMGHRLWLRRSSSGWRTGKGENSVERRVGAVVRALLLPAVFSAVTAVTVVTGHSSLSFRQRKKHGRL